jgi:tetratricopeptide (TPR) repeat protein
MAGMKPKFSCTQCGSVLMRSNELCPSCGVEVDWTEMATASVPVSEKDVPKKEQHEQSPHTSKKTNVWSSKAFFAGIAVVALVLLAYVILDEKRPAALPVQPPSGQTANAAMPLPPEIQELENNVEANPDDMNLTLQLANALHDALQYEKAVSYYKVYLKMNPKNADARVDLGICYKEMSKFTEAENEMKTALHYVPNHVYAHFNLGIVYLSEGNLVESNTWLKRTVALDPNSEVGKRAQQLLTQHNSQTTKQE